MLLEQVTEGRALTKHRSRRQLRLLAQTKGLVEVFQGAGTRPTWVATGTTGSFRRCRERWLGSSSALGRDREYGELGLQFLALTFRAPGFLLAEDQGLELVVTFLADVLEQGHKENSAKKIAHFYLKSKCGYFANTRTDAPFYAPSLVERRACANACEFFDSTTYSFT
jgi:hypothetical protein